MLTNQRGSALLLVLIVFATLFGLLGISLDRGASLFGQIQHQYLEDAALNLAEAGVEYALVKIIRSEQTFSGKVNVALDTGTFSTSVSYRAPSGMIEIFSTGIAKSKRDGETIQKTLKVVLYFDSEHREDVPIVYSWEEVL